MNDALMIDGIVYAIVAISGAIVGIVGSYAFAFEAGWRLGGSQAAHCCRVIAEDLNASDVSQAIANRVERKFKEAARG